MKHPEAVDEQKLRTAVLESITPLSHVVDEIQNLLEGVYSLSELKLQRVSKLLWPRKSHPVLSHNFKIGDAIGTNFSTDWDIDDFRWKKTVVTGTEWGKQIKRQRLMLRFNPRRLAQRGFHFEDLHPVLYVAPEHAEKTQGVITLDQMLTEQRVESLDLITMGVSMFLNANTQYLLHREMAGHIPAYGMTLVDFYHVVRVSTTESMGREGTTGRLELMKTIFGRQGLEQQAFDEQIKAYKAGKHPGYNPLAEHYTDSADTFEGFIYYLINAFDSGRDISGELKQFYRLRGVDKRSALRNLYNQKAEEGDERYISCVKRMRSAYRHADHKWGYVDYRYEDL
ncbi:hypothetical protein HYU94_03770 [Candidatus Daviesbacteria bacterium]|nr:hypothetical protein [Candidatus Daviesbacteria bacterium]